MVKLMSIFIFCGFWFALEVKGEGGCRHLKYLKCIQDKALTGHVISTVRMLLPAFELCQSQCFRQHECISYNLGPVLKQSRLCELNGADHSTRPSFLMNVTGSEYCPIQNPCLSNPCPSGRLCTPDLAWNTFNCNDGGWSQWTPWTGRCSVSSQCLRTRSCDSPTPHNNGRQCIGEDKQTNQCPLIPGNTLQGCSSPLGMEDSRIKDNQITASSFAQSYKKISLYAPWHGRLNKVRTADDNIGGWGSGGKKETLIGNYIEIDLGSIKVITMVATQGQDQGTKWVTKYSLQYSNNGSNWNHYEGPCLKYFPGNSNANTIVTNKLESPIKARHIRLIVEGFYNWAMLRLELYGC